MNGRRITQTSAERKIIIIAYKGHGAKIWESIHGALGG